MIKSQVVPPNDDAVLDNIRVGQLSAPSRCGGQNNTSGAYLTLTTCNPRFQRQLPASSLPLSSSIHSSSPTPVCQPARPAIRRATTSVVTTRGR